MNSAPSAAQDELDRGFMELAIARAITAGDSGEVPVGAVLVVDLQVVGAGANGPIGHCDPTAHAEIMALRDAARALGNYRILGATMYVTVEPCLMCVGAMLHARVARVVFGCHEPKTGALGGAIQLGAVPFDVTGGVCAERSVALLQAFFKARRGA